MVPCLFIVFPFYAGEEGQDPDHLFGGKGERPGQRGNDGCCCICLQETINLEMGEACDVEFLQRTIDEDL